MAITNAYVQSQWEQIKRDIRNGVKEASRETLRQYAKEAMHDIDNQSSYDNRLRGYAFVKPASLIIPFLHLLPFSGIANRYRHN